MLYFEGLLRPARGENAATTPTATLLPLWPLHNVGLAHTLRPCAVAACRNMCSRQDRFAEMMITRLCGAVVCPPEALLSERSRIIVCCVRAALACAQPTSSYTLMILVGGCVNTTRECIGCAMMQKWRGPYSPPTTCHYRIGQALLFARRKTSLLSASPSPPACLTLWVILT